MKSATLPRAEDKKIVRNALPSSNIFTAAVARLYIALPHNPQSWIYSEIWGAVAFCKDRNKNNSYFIRLIDMEHGRGVIWEQELYHGFEYVKDCAFFHTFETDDCMAGLLFVHQGEADVFHEKLLNRDTIKLKDDKKDIGRIGYIPGKGFTVENNDPEILAILRELEKLEDFSPADIDQNEAFIQDFIRQQCKKTKRGPPPPPPPSRKSNRAPPPPIPPMKNKATAPPPVPSRGIRQQPSFSQFPSVGMPPPPPPPPPKSGAPPPPPPLSNNAPTSPIPKATPGRNDLMAAIRNTGGFGSLKKGGSLRSVQSTANNSTRSSSTGSSNAPSMASSLAAVLQQRKTAMQSDDEDEDDDDDWK